MSSKILTTTGFLLPQSDLFEVFRSTSSEFEQFLGRDNNYDLKTLATYYSDNSISHSPHADALYKKYYAEPNFDNFIALVDFTAAVLQGMDCITFMEAQAYNRHAAPISLMLCRDLLQGTTERFYQYDQLSARTRFVLNAAITKTAAQQRYATLVKGIPSGQISWVTVLEPLLQNRPTFVTLFRYLFVSSF